MSGESTVASASPFFTWEPSCAVIWVTRPVTGENTWSTCRSSYEILPLVTTSVLTSWELVTSAETSLASATCWGVTQTSLAGGAFAPASDAWLWLLHP